MLREDIFEVQSKELRCERENGRGRRDEAEGMSPVVNPGGWDGKERRTNVNRLIVQHIPAMASMLSVARRRMRRVVSNILGGRQSRRRTSSSPPILNSPSSASSGSAATAQRTLPRKRQSSRAAERATLRRDSACRL